MPDERIPEVKVKEVIKDLKMKCYRMKNTREVWNNTGGNAPKRLEMHRVSKWVCEWVSEWISEWVSKWACEWVCRDEVNEVSIK